MEELLLLIEQVTEKSKRLKEELNAQNLEVARLKEVLSEITTQKATCEAKLVQLTDELKHKSITHSDNNQHVDIEERVNELVKEIDECIHHLKQ